MEQASRFITTFKRTGILLILAITSGIAFSQEFISPVFTFDTKPPVVTLLSPNGGESFPSSEPIAVTWSAVDEQMGANPVSIAVSTAQNGTFQTLVQNLVNTGNQGVQPPLTSTQYGLFKVSVKDLFGNIGHDESDNYFTLTNGGIQVTFQINNIHNAQGLNGAMVLVQSSNATYLALPTQIPGQYILGIPPGYGYTLQISVSGFFSKTVQNLTFNTNETYSLTYQLEPTSLFSDYQVVPVALAPNPPILEIPEGGIGYAWFVAEGLEGRWFPVPELDLIAEDEQGNEIPCSTNILSYNFLSSIYHMENAGVFSVKIPANIIGNGNPGDQEIITVTKANGEPLGLFHQQSIVVKVIPFTYSSSWGYRIYGKFGAGATTGFATATGFIGGGSGAAMKISLSGLSSNPTWSAFEISRRKDIFVGVDFELGPPDIIPFVDVGYKNELKASFPYQNDFSFDMNKLEGLESLLAFYLFYEPGILFAGKTLYGGIMGPAFLSWAVEALVRNSAENGLGISRYADEAGLDLSNTRELGVSIGPDSPNSFGLTFGPSLGVNAHAGGSVRKTTDNVTETRAYLSGEYDFNINLGPKWIGENSSSGKFLYPFRFRNVSIPSNLGVEFEGKYTSSNGLFQSFKLTAGIESNASWLNFYNLTGQKQKYKAWLDIDNQYVKDLFFNCSHLPSKIANIGKAGVEIESHSNTFEQAVISFLSTVYDEQSHDKPAKLKYGLDAESNSVFNLDLDLEIPVPLCWPVVIKVGGGIETNHTVEYSLANGYWVKALPYLQTEMPNPPGPAQSFATVMDILWQKVISGHPLIELQSVISSHLRNKWIKFWHLKSVTQNVLLNDEGSYLQINFQSIPSALDSLASRHWKWDKNPPVTKALTQEKQKVISKYIKALKKLREVASGLETGIGGYFKFEPEGYVFGDSTLISIKYPDSVVTNIDENKLAIFREDTLGIWHYIPSFTNPDSNRVSAYIRDFTTYTVAPILATGEYGLNPSADSIPSNGISTVTLTSGLMYNADSTLLADGLPFTVSSSRGTILSPDADPSLAGIQVLTQGSTIQFQLRSDTIANSISVMALSVSGYARCQAEVKLFDEIPPAAPVITSAIALDNTVILKWDTVANIDLAGYKIYFDKDSPSPPYNGSASVWGNPSPVNVGLTNTYKLSGLGNDSTFYIAMTAFDISGNESGYSNAVTIFVTPPPSQLEVASDTIVNGASNCYNATDSIIVAGSGAKFIVNSGGSANLVAGQSVILLPGTKVLAGGYLHGYITSNDQYCNLIDTNITVNPSKGIALIDIPVFTEDGPFFRVYPNPTSGKLMISFKQDPEFSKATVYIYNMLGSNVLTDELTVDQSGELSLQNVPAGIYIIKVIIGNQVGTAKIIRQ
ncbi:MAG: T9SS type A sorting domain-containing protein [bacterium]